VVTAIAHEWIDAGGTAPPRKQEPMRTATSDPSIAKHVTDELVTAIAHDVGELLWTKRPASN